MKQFYIPCAYLYIDYQLFLLPKENTESETVASEFFLHTEVLKGRRLTVRHVSHEHFSILPDRLA